MFYRKVFFPSFFYLITRTLRGQGSVTVKREGGKSCNKNLWFFLRDSKKISKKKCSEDDHNLWLAMVLCIFNFISSALIHFTCGERFKIELKKSHCKLFEMSICKKSLDLSFEVEKWKFIQSISLFWKKKHLKEEMSAIKFTELIKCCFGSVPLFLYSPVISHKNINYFVMIDSALIAAFEMSFSLMPVFGILRFCWLEMGNVGEGEEGVWERLQRFCK